MRRTITISAVGLVCALVAAGCGSSDESGSTTASSTAAAAASTTTAAPSTDGMRVAYASELDPNDVADQFGLDTAGAKVSELNSDSAVMAGLAKGNLDVGNVDFDAAIQAKAQGLPITVFYVSQTTPEYIMVSQPSIKALNQLGGKSVAYQEPGSETEIFERNLVKEKAPAVYDQVKWSALAESPHRAAAMLAGRLDASSLESIDLANLRKHGAYNVLGAWKDLSGDAHDVIATAWVANSDALAKDPAKYQALATDLQQGYDKFYADQAAWTALAKQKLPDIDASLLPTVYTSYKSVGMYPKSGTPALTPAIWKANDSFFRSIGEWKTAAPDTMVDYDIVQAGAKG
jgi:ABC-type taurine transport system substrate-binding protein